MKFYRQLLYLTISCLLWEPLFGFDPFLIAPGRVELNLETPHTQRIVITNPGKTPIRLSVEPIYLPINGKDLKLGSPFPESSHDQDDLSPYLLVSPRVLSLQPGQQRLVRISTRPLVHLPDGDYRAHLLVKMKEVATHLKSTIHSSESSRFNLNIGIKMETAVAIYGRKGNPHPKVHITCQQKGDSLQINMVNPSVYHFDAELKATGQHTQTSWLTQKQRLFCLRQSQRTINMPIVLPPTLEPILLSWSDSASSPFSAPIICRK